MGKRASVNANQNNCPHMRLTKRIEELEAIENPNEGDLFCLDLAKTRLAQYLRKLERRANPIKHPDDDLTPEQYTLGWQIKKSYVEGAKSLTEHLKYRGCSITWFLNRFG